MAVVDECRDLPGFRFRYDIARRIVSDREEVNDAWFQPCNQPTKCGEIRSVRIDRHRDELRPPRPEHIQRAAIGRILDQDYVVLEDARISNQFEGLLRAGGDDDLLRRGWYSELDVVLR